MLGPGAYNESDSLEFVRNSHNFNISNNLMFQEMQRRRCMSPGDRKEVARSMYRVPVLDSMLTQYTAVSKKSMNRAMTRRNQDSGRMPPRSQPRLPSLSQELHSPNEPEPNGQVLESNDVHAADKEVKEAPTADSPGVGTQEKPASVSYVHKVAKREQSPAGNEAPTNLQPPDEKHALNGNGFNPASPIKEELSGSGEGFDISLGHSPPGN